MERWEAGLLLVSLLAVAIVLQLARLGWSSSLNVLWAEDGRIFMQEALTHSVLHALIATYGNYLVLAPRLIAEVASLAPLRDAPAAVSILSAATVASADSPSGLPAQPTSAIPTCAARSRS